MATPGQISQTWTITFQSAVGTRMPNGCAITLRSDSEMVH